MKKEVLYNVHLLPIEEVNYGKIFMYYWDFPDKRNDCFCIMGKDDHYMGIITWDDIRNCMDGYELEYAAKKNFSRLSEADIGRINQMYNDAAGWREFEIRILSEVMEDAQSIQEKYNATAVWLESAGVKVIKVCIPENKDMAVGKTERELLPVDMALRCFYSDTAQKIIEPLLSKISSLSYQELKERFMAGKAEHRSKFPENRIFLIGPCIIMGNNTPEDSIMCLLWRKLERSGFSSEAVPIITFRNSPDGISRIQQYDLTNQDIVIMIEEEKYLGKIGNGDIDIISVFNDYHGDKWLYYDIPMHATVYGVELITDRILEKLVPLLDRNKSVEEKVLIPKSGQKMESRQDEKIREFLDACRSKIAEYGAQESIGAIVMNANPFTKGHRYLIESSAQQVSLLIVFVVEEDESYVPFNDRIRLVREGTRELPNVLVMPSGRFILSRATFKNYFEKETLQSSVIDASVDLRIFGERIAKELHITKRFVGEEPVDRVTAQYNEQMKEQLSAYGVEVIEIPRITGNGGVISASRVRKMLKAAS